MLLPVTCPACGTPGAAPCSACRAAIRPAPALALPEGLDGCAAALAYEGPARELVARLKYRNARSAVPFLTASMAALVDASTVDVVTWAPTTTARRRSRGFDHAQLLARAVARRLGLPCRALLWRRPSDGPQTGRSLAQRRRGPIFDPRRTVPARVLLVDDVVTSGATASAAARGLRAGGARQVQLVVAARTPLPRPPAPAAAAVSPARTYTPPRTPHRPVAGDRSDDRIRRDSEEGALPSRSPRGVEREVGGRPRRADSPDG